MGMEKIRFHFLHEKGNAYLSLLDNLARMGIYLLLRAISPIELPCKNEFKKRRIFRNFFLYHLLKIQLFMYVLSFLLRKP